jgi:DNA-binding CsgD family transcriptional regulator
MKHIVLLFYSLSICAACASLFLFSFLLFRYRLRSARLFFLFLTIATLDVVHTVLSFYAFEIIGSASRIISLIDRYSILFCAGVMLYMIFIGIQRLFRKHLNRVKKIVFAFCIFLTPHLVFSSSVLKARWDHCPQFPSAHFILGVCTAGAIVLTIFFLNTGIQAKHFVKKDVLTHKGSAGLALMFVCVCADRVFSKIGLMSQGFLSFPSPAVAGFFFLNCWFLFLLIYRYGVRRCGILDAEGGCEFLSQYGISNREHEIILLICEGFSNKEIGERLFISLSTVKTHVYNIYKKLDVRNRTKLLSVLQGGGSSVMNKDEIPAQ